MLLFNTCTNYFRELRVDGVGTEARPTEVLTREDEEGCGLQVYCHLICQKAC